MKKKLDSRQRRLLYALQHEGFSQKKLADLFDVSQPTVSLALKEINAELNESECKPRIDLGLSQKEE